MCPGSLKHRITIEARALSPNGSGGWDDVWSAFAETWSNIRPASARERFKSEKLEHVVTHKITLRFRNDVTPSMRIIYEGRTFKILGMVNVDEEKRWLELSCEEGAGS